MFFCFECTSILIACDARSDWLVITETGNREFFSGRSMSYVACIGHIAHFGTSTERRLGTRPQLFRFFPRFPSSIRQEISLLGYLDPLNLDCIDARILRLVDF